MADQIETPATIPAVKVEPATPAPDATPAADEVLGEPGKAALAAERTARREADKQLKALQARVQEFEDRDKSETEKLLARAEKAEKAAADLSTAITKRDIAAKFGITDPDDIALFLTGADEDTLTKQAERLAARSAKTPAAPPAAGTQGNVGKPIGAGSEAEQLAKGIEAATKAGRHAEAISLKRQLSALNNKTN